MTDRTSEMTGATEAAAGGSKRLSAKRKLAFVQRLLRGESLETVSRHQNVPVHRLTEWREKGLRAAESALKARERNARDEEIARASSQSIASVNKPFSANAETIFNALLQLDVPQHEFRKTPSSCTWKALISLNSASIRRGEIHCEVSKLGGLKAKRHSEQARLGPQRSSASSGLQIPSVTKHRPKRNKSSASSAAIYIHCPRVS